MNASPLAHTDRAHTALPSPAPASPTSAPANSTPHVQKLRPALAPFHDDQHARRAVASIARQALEVLNGYRPLAALTPFLTLDENRRLQRRATLIQDYRSQHHIKVAPRVSVGGTNLCYVTSDIVETTTIVRDSLRPRFICLRWELIRGHWKITLVEFG